MSMVLCSNHVSRDLKQGRRRRRQWNRWSKMNLRSFKLSRVYLDPLNMPNTGDFPRSWILKGFYLGSKRGREICRRMCTSSIKRQIRKLHVIVVQWTSKKCTQKRYALAELLFWSLTLLFFWSRRCGRPRSCLSSLLSTVTLKQYSFKKKKELNPGHGLPRRRPRPHVLLTP